MQLVVLLGLMAFGSNSVLANSSEEVIPSHLRSHTAMGNMLCDVSVSGDLNYMNISLSKTFYTMSEGQEYSTASITIHVDGPVVINDGQFKLSNNGYRRYPSGTYYINQHALLIQHADGRFDLEIQKLGAPDTDNRLQNCKDLVAVTP